MSAPLVDLAEVKVESELVIEGHLLWVTPGVTEGGRYWQLSTPNRVPVGMVAERLLPAADGTVLAVFEALGPWALAPAATAMWAAVEIVDALATPLCPCGCGKPADKHNPPRSAA